MTQELAKTFSRLLRESLPQEEIDEIICRNDAETSKSICHSHDFCDANMVMHAAGIEVGAWIDAGFDLENEQTVTIWNDAWDLAKTTRFTVRC